MNSFLFRKLISFASRIISLEDVHNNINIYACYKSVCQGTGSIIVNFIQYCHTQSHLFDTIISQTKSICVLSVLFCVPYFEPNFLHNLDMGYKSPLPFVGLLYSSLQKTQNIWLTLFQLILSPTLVHNERRDKLSCSKE